MKINNSLKRLISEAIAESMAHATETSKVRSLFRHALCRKTRLSKNQATWIWHNVVVPDERALCPFD